MGAKEEFITRVNDLYRYEAIQGHLGWDQETIMPSKGAEARGEILAWLAGQRHNSLIDEEMNSLITELEDETHDDFFAANLREMRRKYDEAVKIPTSFVSKFTKARSEALIAWQKARSESDFSQFAPHLQNLIDLTRDHKRKTLMSI